MSLRYATLFYRGAGSPHIWYIFGLVHTLTSPGPLFLTRTTINKALLSRMTKTYQFRDCQRLLLPIGLASGSLPIRFVEAEWEVPKGTGCLPLPDSGQQRRPFDRAHEQYAESDDAVFEIADGMRMLSYWSRKIITPQQAAALLDERGGPPEEDRGNPHKRG
jgi:hypothetical protein